MKNYEKFVNERFTEQEYKNFQNEELEKKQSKAKESLKVEIKNQLEKYFLDLASLVESYYHSKIKTDGGEIPQNHKKYVDEQFKFWKNEVNHFRIDEESLKSMDYLDVIKSISQATEHQGFGGFTLKEKLVKYFEATKEHYPELTYEKFIEEIYPYEFTVYLLPDYNQEKRIKLTDLI